ncbi:MAG: hypothetical protein JEZ12_12890 [Desulfobacterium sp.]|nr:hypothetical protein [Desulfobacterium sp.]
MYLSSYEYEEFEKPRKIVSLTKLKIEGRVAFRVLVDIPVFGQDYGLGGVDVDTLYIVGRFEDIEELNSFPFEVHVLIPKMIGSDTFNSLDQLQNIGWASVYDNEKDAIEHII